MTVIVADASGLVGRHLVEAQRAPAATAPALVRRTARQSFGNEKPGR